MLQTSPRFMYGWHIGCLARRQLGGGGQLWAPRGGPGGAAELGDPLLSWCLGRPCPTSFLWWSPGARANGMALGEPEPQIPPLQGMEKCPHASAQQHGGDVPWEAGLSSPGSHRSCKFDSRNWLLLDGSMTSCKHLRRHQDCHCFRSVSSVWAPLQQDWKFARVCGVLAEPNRYRPLKKKRTIKEENKHAFFPKIIFISFSENTKQEKPPELRF